MKESKFNLKKIKNWFIILGIRLANFIKEHKYVSAGIGVLICTCVIVLVAFASDEDPNGGKIIVNDISIKATSNDSEENLTEAPSFSTINYNVNFKLKCKDTEKCTSSNRKAIIEASIPAYIDAEWISINSNETISKIEKDNDNNKITLTVNDGISLPSTSDDGTNTSTETVSRNIYLKLKNITNDTEITPTIKVYESTAMEDSDKTTATTTTTKVKSDEISLTPMIIGGYKYLEDNNRYVPFGIILGYEGDSLTGKYFNPNQSISVKGGNNEEFVILDNAVYDASTNNYVSHDQMPHYKFNDSLMSFVYDSGSAKLEKNGDVNEYLLNITGLKSDYDLESYLGSYKGNSFIKLGSYYVIAKTNKESESITINVGDKQYKKDNLTTEDVGTQTIDATLTPESESSSKTLAYGEAAYLNVKFTHSVDSASSLKNAVITVPINENFDLEKYSDTTDFNINDEYKKTDESGKSIVDTDKVKTLYICSGEGTGETVSEAKNNANCGSIKEVKFTISEVSKGSNVDINLRLKVSSDAQKGSLTYDKVSVNYNGTNKESTTENNIIITPFKARTKVAINGTENDAIVDMSNSSTTNIKIYPSVYAPAALLSSTALKGDSLNFIMVQVDLPEGMEYVSGSSNVEFIAQKDTNNRLIYFVEYESFGSTIKSISFDTRSSISSSGEKNITVKAQAISLSAASAIGINFNSILYITAKTYLVTGMDKDIDKVEERFSNVLYKDYSSEIDRTVTKKINFQSNDSNLIYRNNASKLYASRNDSFNFETEVYNPTESNMNFDLILKLPEKNLEDASFTGAYTVSGVPDNALCAYTYDQISDASFEECPDEINDSSVRLIKLENINLDKSNNYYKVSMTITPNENKVGDKYKYSSIIIQDGESKNIPSVTTSIYSKRISGNVWEDFNEDGLLDEEEEKIEGIEFSLHKITYKKNSSTEFETDDIVATTKSNYKGEYEFLAEDDGSDIEYGYYYIEANFYNQKYGLTAYREDISNEYSKSIFKAMDEENTEETEYSRAKTDVFEIKSSTKNIVDKNLGLTLKKVYNVKISKYLTKAVTTNALGISTTKEFGDKVTFAKLDVKDINNLTIKVVYTIEVQNTGYYPGYVYAINDYIPDGMSFNQNYEENRNWISKDNGTLVYEGLKDTLIRGAEKKYVTLALDITSKEAGSFVNYASVTDDNIKIFSKNNDLLESGDGNE